MQLDQLDETRLERRALESPHTMSLLKDCYLERGTIDDWHILSELHYKSSNLGIGPRYVRCVLDDGLSKPQVIGVQVFTVPKPLDSGRNVVFPGLSPNRLGRDNTFINKQRMAWLNRNLILHSRAVLDTMYRGAGLGYRVTSLSYRLMGFRFVEARGSMSRFNPFLFKAGMRFVTPKPAAALMNGLKFFQRNFVCPGYDYVGVRDELAAMPDHIREKVTQELREFYYKHSSMEKSGDNRLNGTSRVDGMAIPYLLKQIQQLVFGSTIYSVWTNPDWDAKTQKVNPMPARLPVLAFDWQGVNEPLRRDLLQDAP